MDYASSPSFSSSSYPDQILPDCQKTSSVVYVLDFDLMNHFASLKLLCNSLSRPFCLNLSLFRFEVISVFWNLYAHTHVDACHHNTLTLWAEIHKQDPAFLRYFWGNLWKNIKVLNLSSCNVYLSLASSALWRVCACSKWLDCILSHSLSKQKSV